MIPSISENTIPRHCSARISAQEEFKCMKFYWRAIAHSLDNTGRNFKKKQDDKDVKESVVNQ